MSASTEPVRARRRGRLPRWTALTTAAMLAAGISAIVVTTGTAAAYAAAPAPGVTRAAIAPALTAGSIPDAPDGGGIVAPLDVRVNGSYHRMMTLASLVHDLQGVPGHAELARAGRVHSTPTR